jgi:hypothetical protein
MQNRTVLVILTFTLCASFALGANLRAVGRPRAGLPSTLDVATEIVSPIDSQYPGLVPVQVRLTNMGDTAALVARLDAVIYPSGYSDYVLNISVGVGSDTLVTMNPWVCPALARESCTAWITYPADANHSNDTDVVIVHTGPFFEDVAVEIVSPRAQEQPGLVPVQVKLKNVGYMAALVPRLDLAIRPGGYWDYKESIAVSLNSNQEVTLNLWDYAGDNETCIAWITYPADTNRLNDAEVVFVIPLPGISGRVSIQAHAGLSLALLPSPLAGNVLHVAYGLNHAGPASVTLFDISGRPAACRRFVADREGELPLDLRLLSGGVYLVRLDDGHQSLVEKLVVQR